jgi:filamentous hemagglutinin family protein
MSDITCLRTRKHRRAWERAIRRLARRAARHAGVAIVPSLLPVIALFVAPPALALPLGGQVASGNVTIGTPAPNTMAITQGTPKGIVNWNSFSIGANETVNIAQPSAQAVLLNRVVGSQASTIAGRMNANGQVFLVNPAGVLFARGASVNVGSLVASTLGISDRDFLAGKYRFASASPQAGGQVVNQGTITAGEHGTVALLGAQVDNSGTVSAKLGTVAMGAGSDITLDFAGDGLTMLKVNGAAAQALARNSGVLAADGGQVLMSVQTADALAATVLNQTGTVRAQSVAERNGRIVLDGGAAGVTEVAGSVDSTGGAGLKGGNIDVTGYQVAVHDGARIDASGAAGGGRVRVGGGAAGKEADIHNADAVWMGPGAQVRADALVTGDGGNIVIYGTNAARVYGMLTAKGGAQGGNGGLIETSARFLDVAGAEIDASALHGVGGTWVLDPHDVDIVADSSALDFATSSDTTGWTFSPVSPTGSASRLGVGQITGQLNQGVSVTVNTGASGTDLGTIKVLTNITKGGDRNAALTLNAAGSIHIDTYASTGAALVFTAPQIGVAQGLADTGRLDVNLNANVEGRNPSASVTVNGMVVGGVPTHPGIATNGGNLVINGAASPGNAASVELTYAAIDTTVGRTGTGTGGSITIRGSSPFDTGVSLSNSTMTSGSGAITIEGHGGTRYFSPEASNYDYVDAFGSGVSITNTGLRTTSGAVSVTGFGATGDPTTTAGLGPGALSGDGVQMSNNSSINSTSGAVTIRGTAAGSTAAQLSVQGDGVAIAGSRLITGGAMSINGTGAVAGAATTTTTVSGVGDGVVISNATITSAGALDITGRGATAGGARSTIGGAGVYVATSRLTSSGGDVTIDGTSAAGQPRDTSTVDHFGGVVIQSSDVGATTGNLSIFGVAPPGVAPAGGVVVTGMNASQNLGIHANGNVRIFGIGNVDSGVALAGTPGNGDGQAPVRGLVSSAAGSVDIRGGENANASFYGYGLALDAVNVQASAPGQTVSLTGSTPADASAILFSDTTVSAGSTGTIIVRADNAGRESTVFSDSNAFFSAPSGTIVFVPGKVGPDFAIVNDDAQTINVWGLNGGFTVGPSILGAVSSSIDTVVIGSTSHTGQIAVNACNYRGCPSPAQVIYNNLTLENQGTGSKGIALLNRLSVQASRGGAYTPGKLTFASAGPVTQGAQGITAGIVTLTGLGPFELTNGANVFSTLALVNSGNATVVGTGNFSIAGTFQSSPQSAATPVTFASFDNATQTVTQIGSGGIVTPAGNTSVTALAGTGTPGTGVITVADPLVKTSPGRSTLTLNAADTVIFAGNISAPGGPLDIKADAGNRIAIHGYRGESPGVRIGLSTNGGNVTLGTGATASGYGGSSVTVADADIDARATSAQTTDGSITIHGVAPAYNAGVPQTAGVDINDARLLAGSGGIELAGRAHVPTSTPGSGVLVRNSQTAAALQPGPSQLTTTSGAIRVYGTGSGAGAVGVALLDGSSITTTGGPIDLRGAITGTGTGTPSPTYGLLLLSGAINASAPGVTVSLAGSTTTADAGIAYGAVPLPANSGLVAGPFSISTGPQGLVTMRSSNNGAATSLIGRSAAQSIDAQGGSLFISPASADPSTFDVTAQNAVPITLFGTNATQGLSIDAATYQTFSTTLQTLVLGSSTQTGHISVRGSCEGGSACAQRPAVASGLTLQNTGAGSQGIDLPSGISLPGKTLALASSGIVTDPGGIQAQSLLLAGGGDFTLTDAGNDVNTLALAGAHDVSFKESHGFTIGPVSAQGFDGATGRAATIDGTQSTVTGNLAAMSDNGRVSLGSVGSPTHLSAGGSIDLVMQNVVLDNAAGGTLSAGNGWRVWVRSRDQQENRGGIDPGGALPNFYGCVYGGICSWNGQRSLAVVPGNSNHFVYAERPTLTVTIGGQTRSRGSANGPFGFTVSGLLRGDQQGNSLAAGPLGSPATTESPGGTYPISGTFSSPTGYNVVVTPGTLTVQDPLANGGVFNRSGLQPLFTAQEDSFVYESNLGGVNICVGTNQPILALQEAEGAADTLAAEWKRVRSRPNLNNCLVVNGQHGCGEF